MTANISLPRLKNISSSEASFYNYRELLLIWIPTAGGGGVEQGVIGTWWTADKGEGDWNMGEWRGIKEAMGIRARLGSK